MSNFSPELVSPLAQELLRSQNVFMQPHESFGQYPGLKFAGDDFYVDIETGFTPEDLDPEPDTLLIADVVSGKKGKGLATAALSNILVQAKELRYRYAFMMIIAPRMVRIAQTLTDLDYASSVGFAVYSHDNTLIKSTQIIAESSELSADQAYTCLSGMITNTAELTARTGMPQDMPGHISCALDLRG